MNYFKIQLEAAIKNGDLELDGDARFLGELIYDHVEQKGPGPNPTPTVEGFYGLPDAFACRRNIYADEVIEEFAKSDNQYERQAAKLAPTLFMYWDSLTNNMIGNTPLEAIYRSNVHQSANKRAVQPLLDANNEEVPGKHFLPLGLALYPAYRDRVSDNSVIKYIKQYIRNEIINQAFLLEHGDLESRI